MLCEIRGTPDPGKVPVVLLHGAISATGTSSGPRPGLLAQTRPVIAVQQQGHGRTAGAGRPLPVQAMADDTLALLASLGIAPAGLLGYSLGAGRTTWKADAREPPFCTAADLSALTS
jgi:pimeloyl-ACP methyl ester carboxylesterase